MTPRKIMFYGTCQMQVLAQTYEIFVVPHTNDQVTYAGPGRAFTPTQQAAMAQADISVEQITPMGQPGPEGIPPRAQILRVPLVDGSFLWPFSGARHPDSLRRYGTYNPFTAEVGDSWLLKAMARGLSPDHAVAAYMNEDAAKSGRADRRRGMALDSQAAREAGTRYRFAPLIEEHTGTERLFRTPYHLEARLQNHMLFTLIDDIGVPDAARQAAVRFAPASLYAGSTMPVHPALAAHFGLTWTDATTRSCFWREEMLDFEGFAKRFVHCEAYPDMNIAADAVMRAQPDGQALLDAALAKLPDSPWGLHAQAVLHLREGRTHKARATLNRVVRLHPALNGVYATLQTCLTNLGHHAEALDALREEIRRQPHRIPFRLRLAQLLRAAGDADAAVALANEILQLQPGHDLAGRIRVGRDASSKPGGRSRPPGPPA